MTLEKSFVLKMGPPLYRFYLARFSRETAEDLVQEVFARLANSQSYRHAEGNLEAFTWGIALNLQKETARSTNRYSLEELEEHPAGDPTDGDDFRDLRQAVGKLNPPEIHVMQLVLADLSVDEIAKHLKMPAGNVKSHIFRAKENLRIQLTKVFINEKR